jgi:hypothetical protein
MTFTELRIARQSSFQVLLVCGLIYTLFRVPPIKVRAEAKITNRVHTIHDQSTQKAHKLESIRIVRVIFIVNFKTLHELVWKFGEIQSR